MKRLLYILILLLPMAVRAVSLTYTLPVYELKSEYLAEKFADICQGRYSSSDYLVLTTSQWQDTIFSMYTGEALSIYNTYLQARVIAFHGFGEEDYCKQLLGCCRIGEHWLMTRDSATLRMLFLPTDRKQTFVRNLSDIEILSAEAVDHFYINGDSVSLAQMYINEKGIERTKNQIFRFLESSNPDSAAAAYFSPQQGEILQVFFHEAIVDSLSGVEINRYFSNRVQFPQDAPQTIDEYRVRMRLTVSTTGRITNIEYLGMGNNPPELPLPCFAREIWRVASSIQLRPIYHRGHLCSYQVETYCFFQR